MGHPVSRYLDIFLAVSIDIYSTANLDIYLDRQTAKYLPNCCSRYLDIYTSPDECLLNILCSWFQALELLQWTVDTLHSGDCHSRSASPSPSQHTVVSIVPCVTFYILMLPSNPGPEEWTVRTRWTAGDMTQVVAQEAQCPACSRSDGLCAV